MADPGRDRTRRRSALSRSVPETAMARPGPDGGRRYPARGAQRNQNSNEEGTWLVISAACVSRSWPPTASNESSSSSHAAPCTARAPRPNCCRSIPARSRPGSSTWFRPARSKLTSSSPTPPPMTTTRCCCPAAPSTPTSCGSTPTRWRSSRPSPRRASPSRRSATARGRSSQRASSRAAGSPPGPACAMTCAMPARSRSTSKSSSTASSPPAAPRRTCPPSARRSSSSSPAAGYRASRWAGSTVPAAPSSALPKEILVKAVVYHGPRNVSVDEVPDARIERPTDALVKITATNICGSDLHMYEGRTDFEEGRVFGHENVGEVVEVGDAVDKVKVGDMISAPFNVACGHCRNCEEQRTNYCLRANEPGIAGAAYGFADMGPWQGGQAELLRVPWADFNALVLPEDARDKQDDYVMLSDIFPTGWHAVKMSGLLPGETIVIYGGGWPSRSARSRSMTRRAPRSSRSWSRRMAWVRTAAPNASATRPTTPRATKTTP